MHLNRSFLATFTGFASLGIGNGRGLFRVTTRFDFAPDVFLNGLFTSAFLEWHQSKADTVSLINPDLSVTPLQLSQGDFTAVFTDHANQGVLRAVFIGQLSEVRGAAITAENFFLIVLALTLKPFAVSDVGGHWAFS